jgi:hypothetical protein
VAHATTAPARTLGADHPRATAPKKSHSSISDSRKRTYEEMFSIRMRPRAS